VTVLVTGGTGVLGAYVLRQLAQRGEPSLAVSSRADPALLGDLSGAVPLLRCDIRDGDGLRALMQRHRPSVVIHLAAMMPAVCRQQPAEAVDVNVTATARLYATEAQAGVERFVYASSKSAYGAELPAQYGAPEYRLIPEELPAKPVWIYDVTKRAGELMIEAQRRLGGPEATSLRFATIYGPGKGARYGGASALSSLIEAAIDQRPFTLDHGGDQVDDVIWVGDAAAGVVSAALSAGQLRSLYNIATGTGITIRRFAQRVAEECPGAAIEVGPGMRYMGDEPTYGILDPARARADLGFTADPDPRRGVRLFTQAVSALKG
jgi:UDP-glucose 4-epimerase